MNNAREINAMAKRLFAEERTIGRLDGWFLTQETWREKSARLQPMDAEGRKAALLVEALKALPLAVSDHAVFCGTQRDAFARTYALINPAFRVETFSGYCDPTSVYGDIEPNETFTVERIAEMRQAAEKSPMVDELRKVYARAEPWTKEVLFFAEQVTGHVIPDFRPALKRGVGALIEEARAKNTPFHAALATAMSGVTLLADRYADLVRAKIASAAPARREQLEEMVRTLEQVRLGPARSLHEALQLFILLWQVMCLEQAPNPYAFSVGNADRIFEPYRRGMSREDAAALFRHWLVFFNVGDRSWAISQNVLLGGRDADGNDLSNETTYAILDAYFDMNLPQPILSVKLHGGTPERLYRELGRFFFSPGVLTPSLFNDDAIFEVLSKNGVAREDLADYSVAGCQEPLVMGKDNGNTTNSWLNLPKVLEMVLTGGRSAVTGKKLVDCPACDGKDVRAAFYAFLDRTLDAMAETANGCSRALSNLRVPFLSAFMGGLESGVDMRDPGRQGTKYNGSGCLVHGLAVLADSFVAIDHYLKAHPDGWARLVEAVKTDFAGAEDLRSELRAYPKFGNNLEEPDREAADIARRVATAIRRRKNYLGNPFRPDFATPSTHLLYGYWVGATPDGRKSRDMLNYGVDPLYGEATNGLGFRMLSNMNLPFGEFNGGYASHLGLDPKHFPGATPEEKGLSFRDNVVTPLFFNPLQSGVSPFYLYVNVTTAETLRNVLAEPKRYAPSGVYIMRIHGTFVNFLDLSPAIQRDIITRLDAPSTAQAVRVCDLPTHNKKGSAK